MRLLRCLGSARPTARISALSGAPRMPATRTRVTGVVDVRGRTNERRPNGKCDAAVLARIPRDSNEAYSRRHLPRLARRAGAGGAGDGAKGRPESDCARERGREFNPAKSWHNKQLLPFRRNCAWHAARAETAFAGGISIKYMLHTINPFNPVTSGRTGNTVIVAMFPRGSLFEKIFDSADNYARESRSTAIKLTR